MTTQRFDIYRLIHKGMRAYLSDTLLAAGRMDYESKSELDAGLDALHGLLDFCESHLQHENMFIHPAMEKVQAGSAQEMDEHHQQHRVMIGELRQIAVRLRQAAAGEREGEASQLYRKLALFVANNLAHMHEEETRNNAILWRGYTDEDIISIHDALLRTIPADENAIAMRWMLSAFNPQERQRMLREIQQDAPQPAFQSMMDLARCTLSVSEWNKLQLAMGF